jgi:hypothetical protein
LTRPVSFHAPKRSFSAFTAQAYVDADSQLAGPPGSIRSAPCRAR